MDKIFDIIDFEFEKEDGEYECRVYEYLMEHGEDINREIYDKAEEVCNYEIYRTNGFVARDVEYDEAEDACYFYCDAMVGAYEADPDANTWVVAYEIADVSFKYKLAKGEASLVLAEILGYSRYEKTEENGEMLYVPYSPDGKRRF